MRGGDARWWCSCSKLSQTLSTLLDLGRTHAYKTNVFFIPNAKLTHGSLKAADGNISGQGEGTEAAEAASVTEPVKP